MLSRNLTIAVLISLAVHIFFFSGISIVTPVIADKKTVYPRVEFLGPIFRKTSFDLMLNTIDPFLNTEYKHPANKDLNSLLAIKTPKYTNKFKTISSKQQFTGFGESIHNFLSGSKFIPYISEVRQDESDAFNNQDAVLTQPDQKLIYSPEKPGFFKGMYDDKVILSCKVRFLISKNGKIKDVELIRSTGYPDMDMKVLKYVKSWIYEPSDKKSGENPYWNLETIEIRARK